MKLSDIAIEKLINLITVQKKYQPGDKLPCEEGLAQELGVSRNTVRTAVRYLVGQGVLEIRIGRGTYVARQSQISADFGFDQLKYLHLKLKDLYELRLMLEPQMAYYAALRATDEELQRIMDIGMNLQQHVADETDDSRANFDFHIAIAQAAHNEFGVKLSEVLNNALLTAFAENRIRQTIGDFLGDHQLIMDYLRKRDADGVKLAMDLHLKNSMRVYNL